MFFRERKKNIRSHFENLIEPSFFKKVSIQYPISNLENVQILFLWTKSMYVLFYKRAQYLARFDFADHVEFYST